MDNKIKNATIMMLGTGLNALIGLITVPLITRIVSPSNYGEFSILQTYISIVVSLSLMGFDQAYVRHYYQVDSVVYRSYLTRKIVFVPFVISIIFGAIFALLSINLVKNSHVRLLLFLCVVVTVLENFTRLNLRMEQDTKSYSIVLISHRVIYALVAIILLILVPNQDVFSLLIATILSLAVVIVVAMIRKRHIWFCNIKAFALKENTQNIVSNVELLRYSIPFIFSSISNWLFNATGKITLQKYATYSEIGYYSAAASIVTIVTIFQTTFSTIWVPMAVEHYERRPKEKTFFVKSNDLACLGMIFIGMSVVLVKDLIGWMLGGDYRLASYIFPCLVLQPVLFTISETTVYGINFYKKTYWHIIITTISCIVNIIGNLLFVPSLGAQGAAISTGSSYIVFLILRTVLSNKYHKVNFHYGKMICSISLLVIFCLYSTFYSFGFLTILYFLVSCFILLFLYKDLIKIAINTLKKGVRWVWSRK